ncbi:MAG: urate hydroxylase PuuD [Methylotenera sp.]|nr:urate hydroxylase PuuD [Oligoflexia bacterium]
MNQDILDWILLLGRWLHITVAVAWIGTSIFFMWLDRTLEFNGASQKPGHVGELWMVHGGGFYHVEKLLMGPTKVPEYLHWFKWESYWTWMSGAFLLALIFYTGGGTFLLDSTVSGINFWQAAGIGIGSILISWLFYDFVWERELTRRTPWIGHFLTLAWLAGMSYFLCHTLSGRAAYIHIGAMLGSWMTANVFLRIIPRQIKMVEASKKGEPVNQEWGKNAKNRSTHNTYFTLPVIFLMISNHFPATYGHPLNWVILLVISAAGAAIREFFVVRVKKPTRAWRFAAVGISLILGVILFTRPGNGVVAAYSHDAVLPVAAIGSTSVLPAAASPPGPPGKASSGIHGSVRFEGDAPAPEKLQMPPDCKNPDGGDSYSNQIQIKDGMIKNVLVRVTKGFEGKTFTDIPSETVVLDQRGCLYVPRVVAARVGQKVEFLNSDSTIHNVRMISKNNPEFNEITPKKNDRITKIFAQPELFMQSRCNVHPWMGAYIAVMDHPYFGVSDANGEFVIPALPPGKYTFEAWHEVFGKQTQVVDIQGAGIVELRFTFKKQGQ